jgi:hypothetical protein
LVSTKKVSWPIEVQAIIIRNNVIGGLSASAAFEAGVQEYNDLVESGEVEGTMMPTELPQSYTNKNAGSVLYGLKQRFLKRVNKGDPVTREAAERFGIIEAAPEAAPEPTFEDTEDTFEDTED